MPWRTVPVRKISTHRRSVPLARPVSPCKRCPPVPTSRMYADFTGTMISRKARGEKTRAPKIPGRHDRPKYAHEAPRSSRRAATRKLTDQDGGAR